MSALTAAPVTAPDGEPRPGELRDRITGDAVRAAVVLSAAWVLTAPYALPWYDALVWAPLALVGPSLLDRALLARLVVLSLAYVPGRVVGLTPLVETLTLGFRRYVAPLLVLAVVVTVVRWALRGSAGGGRAGPRAAPPAAPAP